MADRRVERSGKDRAGDITALCGGWGRTEKAQAIRDIEGRAHHYFVRDSVGRTADVHVVNGINGKYLRTDPNSRCSDNLDNIPNC